MTTPAAFRATYSDLKLIKTRQCVQIVFELPLADFDAAYQVLGGMPNPAKETWFGIAPLVAGAAAPAAGRSMANGKRAEQGNPGGSDALTHHDSNPSTEASRDEPAPEKPRRDWRELQPAQQAGIRCNDPIFQAFLKEHHPEDWRELEDAAALVRFICGVHSRVELGTNQKARVLWHQLDTEFQAWEAKERVGA